MKTSIAISLVYLLTGLSNILADNYLEQLDKSFYAEYAVMKMEMHKDNKMMRHYEMEYYRQGDKMRMEFTAPATEKGRRMLNDNTSLWMYLPRTSKIMKQPFKQSFMGSDASNTDLMRMSFRNDYEIETVSNQGKGIVVLYLKAKNAEVAYDKTVVEFDTRKKVPIKQEMYSISGKLIKTIFYENPILVDDLYFPSTMIIKEELQKNTETKIYYSDIRKKTNRPAEYFTLGALKR
ncbi:MAG: outer membrane lipoprotein-sorting protein [Proteiniphilum sp.]|uniref:outer membrane lipoprotein-sorting protein n=1 Tax=Proteiniphilum sp. TaxID=1926877 RepID=UPI002B20A943|nr:outer membrane lipoprotein-sorting protein [Proteiniphilum sp.]MEA5126637.1 outer membrane lipoprotein-sorting protein [Proteiniphilum sp.]